MPTARAAALLPTFLLALALCAGCSAAAAEESRFGAGPAANRCDARPRPGTACRIDHDCGFYRCDPMTLRCETRCTSDFACGADAFCAAGACVPPGSCGYCRNDRECTHQRSGNFRCDVSAQRCRTRCESDADCQNNTRCRGGHCTNSTECSSDGECGSGERCWMTVCSPLNSSQRAPASPAAL